MKDLSLLANKLIEKIPGPRSAIEQYQSFIRKKTTKLVKQSEIITCQPKTFQIPNIVYIKSILTKYPKTSHNLFKTNRKGLKVGSN